MTITFRNLPSSPEKIVIYSPPIRKVFKYILPFQKNSSLDLPYEAKIIDAKFQGENLCIWAVVNQSAHLVKRHFEVICTGDFVPNNSVYINTVHSEIGGSPLVFHVFEVLPSIDYSNKPDWDFEDANR